jgi:predicted amidohydrolase YtcJ
MSAALVALSTFLVLASSTRAEQGTGPTVYRGGQVFTGRSDHVDAGWFVVDGGKIADVGDGAIPPRWQAARTVELGGRFVAPGFVDAHVHFVEGGLSLLQVDAGDARSADAVRAAVARAADRPLGGWVVVRNVGLDVLEDRYPTHEGLASVIAPAAGKPVLLLLKGGHHVYASPAGLVRLAIDGRSPDPAGGTIVRDASGAPTGLLVDAAAWDAVRALEQDLDPETIAQAIVAAQRLAVRYGITTVGDNTFFPANGAAYARMAKAGVLRLRVSVRSFGPEPFTRLTMKSLGAGLFGRQDPQVRYFGDKYFVDGALSTAGASASGAERIEAGPRYGVGELRELMIFAGPFGTAFHTQSREGVLRLVEARAAITSRRAGAGPDVIDHCGRCGADDLPRRIRDAGFRVTVLPGQLHELPALLRDLPPATHASLLPMRELFGAGVEPALTSDWPFGAEASYPDLPDGFHRTGLAPLAGIAVATSGREPSGDLIAGVGVRTIPMGAALLGATVYGARAVGRDDVGQIAPGLRADFVVLPSSPFQVDARTLYRTDPVATYIDGSAVWGGLASEQNAPMPPDAVTSQFTSRPTSHAFSPILGYDPIPGFLVGGAYFFFPYAPRGLRGSLQAFGSISQGRGFVEGEFIDMRGAGRVSPRLWLRANTLEERYYGVGMGTVPNAYVETDPVRVEGSLGATLSLSRTFAVAVDVRGGGIHDGKAAQIEAFTQGAEGPVDGAFAGARAELAHDTRDSLFATRRGGREILWSETYAVEASRRAFRQLAGLTLTRFIPLRAPDLILALRAQAATSLGERSYATDYALGGAEVLRGYYTNRFRGDRMVAGAAELRVPLLGPLSAVGFGELGRIWAKGSDQGGVGRSAGFGVRYGLPPDRLVRLRLDAGFAADQWGIFFKFGEAF